MAIAMVRNANIAMAGRGTMTGVVEEAIASAAADVKMRRAELVAALSERDNLVASAIETGQLSWRRAAKAAGIQLGAVHRILTDAGAGDLGGDAS